MTKNFFNKPLGRIIFLCAVALITAGSITLYHHIQADGNTINTDALLAESNSTGTQVSAWDHKYSYLITNLENDFSKAQQAVQANDDSALTTACIQIVSDASTAQRSPSTPDSSIQTDWSTALTDDENGGSACAEGASQDDSNLISQATTDFSNGSNALERVTKGVQGF